MKEQLLAELTELAEQVPDKYDDFIQSVIDFIKEDPTRTTSDIIEYLDELGI